MEKHFKFNNGETVDIIQEFNEENNTFLTQMVFTGLDKEEKSNCIISK